MLGELRGAPPVVGRVPFGWVFGWLFGWLSGWLFRCVVLFGSFRPAAPAGRERTKTESWSESRTPKSGIRESDCLMMKRKPPKPRRPRVHRAASSQTTTKSTLDTWFETTRSCSVKKGEEIKEIKEIKGEIKGGGRGVCVTSGDNCASHMRGTCVCVCARCGEHVCMEDSGKMPKCDTYWRMGRVSVLVCVRLVRDLCENLPAMARARRPRPRRRRKSPRA